MTSPDLVRKIIHIDMDAFYASVEERDRPELRGKPVVVGGSPDSRGVVATANYAARRYGVHSAMPAAQAFRLCPFAEFIRPRFEIYRSVSRQIMDIFQRYSDCVEPLSLDEAYLDVSDSPVCHGSATLIARAIKGAIKGELKLTASAGVSYNKFLAKTASGINKPDGLTVILPNEGASFVQKLPIGSFYGIGQATETKMKRLGIHTGADLLRWSQNALVTQFGKVGYWYAMLARGEDPRPVRAHRERKSLGHETTFAQDISSLDHMVETVEEQVRQILAQLAARHWQAHTLTLKVKYANFEQVTRSCSFSQPIDLELACSALRDLLDKTEVSNRAVRLLGVSVSSLISNSATELQSSLDLF